MIKEERKTNIMWYFKREKPHIWKSNATLWRIVNNLVEYNFTILYITV